MANDINDKCITYKEHNQYKTYGININVSDFTRITYNQYLYTFYLNNYNSNDFILSFVLTGSTNIFNLAINYTSTDYNFNTYHIKIFTYDNVPLNIRWSELDDTNVVYNNLPYTGEFDGYYTITPNTVYIQHVFNSSANGFQIYKKSVSRS